MVLAGLCLISGLIVRLAGMRNIFGYWPTEDGYLMLTIARNISLGFGMSVSDGTVATNGTQPLATFLYAIGFFLFSGDKQGGVVFCLLLQIIFSVLCAWLMFRLARKFLPDSPGNRTAAALGAGLWFLGPVTLPHTMNCLESGVYAVCILLTLLYWYRWMSAPESGMEWGKAVRLGLLLGVTMWARIDAVFLAASICGAHLVPQLRSSTRRASGKLPAEAAVAGIVGLAAISPWLIYAKINFGYWMPISGVSERVGALAGGNLPIVPVKLFEYLAAVVGIPSALEEMLWMQAACGVALVAWIIIIVSGLRRASQQQRQLGILLAMFATLLTIFYGASFGAAHFLSRYFFPVSVLVIPVSVYMVIAGARKSTLPGFVLPAIAVVASGIAGAQQIRLLVADDRNPHLQIVEWVKRHVPDDVWVGAAQSGTLGFFHDRTLNFDGKVDPRCLDAIIEQRVYDYIAQSPVQVIADWNNFADWSRIPAIRENFELAVDDPEKNLAVFVRQ